MNYDPILGETPAYSIPQLEEEQKKIAAKVERLKNMQQPQKPQCPVWDEIDGIVSGMSDQELHAVSANPEYQESSAAIQEILQREYLRIMRPIVEGTKDGRDALEKHLTIVKRLRKAARDEVARKYSLMDEYMEHYSNMPFDEYMKIKRGRKGGAK